jgi:signal transduction histidine kinase
VGAAWWRQAIERRLTAVVIMALVLWIAVTSTAGTVVASRVTHVIVDERASHARHIAARIEHEIEDELRRLDAVAAVLERGGEDAAIRAAVQELKLAEAVVRVSRDGEVTWARSVRRGDLLRPPVTRVAINGGLRWRAQPTDLLETEAGRRALLLLPARESDPEGGAFAAVIPPDTAVVATMLDAYRDDAFVVRLLDAQGAAIARSRPSTDEATPLLATAQVLRTSWSVQISQPRSEALAAMNRLKQILFGGSLLLTVVAVLMAWGTARSIRQPVERLTMAAERLAAGDLEQAMPSEGPDEIGRLAEALERLRVALVDDERRSRLLKGVLSAQEDERRRIARELHDETTQQLTALALQIDMAQRGGARASLVPARALVNTMIDGLHRVIYDLRPSVLDDLGLLPAIRSYGRTHLEANGIAVHYEGPDELQEPLEPEATTAIYRIVQEALANVLRHAQAEAVQIACAVDKGVLTIEIEDDGAGFDPRTVSRPRASGQGLGLLGMRERLSLLGGRLAIDAAPGAGTRVTITLPLGPGVVRQSSPEGAA